MENADRVNRLLSAVADCDVAAFRELYDLTLPRLTRTVLGVARDPALTEDILQVSFVRIWRRAAQYDPARGSALGWMMRICRNAAIDEQRRARAGRARLRHVADVLETDTTGARPAPVARYLHRLSVEQAQALAAVYEQGLTHAELAQRLGEPLGTVKSRVRRGLIALRQALQEAEP